MLSIFGFPLHCQNIQQVGQGCHCVRKVHELLELFTQGELDALVVQENDAEEY